MKFTVIGMYDNGQSFADVAEGADAYEAMSATARRYGSEALTIVGAIAGEHGLSPACEESGNVACSVDLP